MANYPEINDLGSRIKFVRNELEQTQAGLATAIGVSVSYVSEVERGVKQPNTNMVQNLAKLLPDLDVRWLLTGGRSANTFNQFTSAQRDSFCKALIYIVEEVEKSLEEHGGEIEHLKKAETVAALFDAYLLNMDSMKVESLKAFIDTYVRTKS